ncbi:site-specific DNA-methyltransferase [bacterium]|nr:site-specific DNA-methyltransferase [bacterium]MBU1152993.1 site-specific DNA-methyltransferase [bacterium]MBU2599655.1 site-specific DNA-methyltransferase [bacterium]
MRRLNDVQINAICELLKEGKPLPEDYKWLLFEGKQETELIYAGKTREVDVVAETMAVPLQKVKVFGNVGDDEWHNMLIFGDNLQVLKKLLKWKEEGKLKNPDGSKGVKLIYIDPPFATRQEFSGSRGEKAYQDKIIGAKFLEWLRQRLILMKELLSNDGSIYVHMDYRKGQYCKIILDEVFQEVNFRNEIVWCYTGPSQSENYFPRKHEYIYFYAKSSSSIFNPQYISHKSGLHNVGQIFGDTDTENDEYVRELEKRGKKIEDWWIDIWATERYRSELLNYPTQKPEALLERIIKASSNPGDLVLDCFAGSGTTGAVAEKLNRRWIMTDSSKFAIYTIIKRMLNFKEQLGNKGNPLRPKPFAVYNAGLYDIKMLKQLPFKEYREFALQLFQCKDEPHTLAGIKLDGYFGQDHVLVFKWKKNGNEDEYVIDRGFIDNLHSILGKRIGKRFFVIAPAASVLFLEDYIEKDRVKYYVLRIPYSIIDELHKKNFKLLEQPLSADISEVNKVMEQIGFDFIYPPDVECEYYIEDKKGQLEVGQSGEEAVIKIKNFRSNIISKKPIPEEELGFKALSMVMIDYAFNSEYFSLDDKWFAQDLEKNGYEIHCPTEKLTDKMMIIYMDVYGNERKEIKTREDFKR